MNYLADERIMGQVLDEVANEILREDLWRRALEKSRRDEEKAKGLYIEYRFRSIKDEAVIAKTLAEENSNTIIQRYIAKTGDQDVTEESPRKITSNNSGPGDCRKKKCFKCGKIVVLAVKPCPYCLCNSFIFCR